MQKTYEVEGMHCQSCERKVGEALRDVPGVRDAEVSISTRIATVEADEQVDAGQLDARVQQAGDYHIRSHQNGHSSGHKNGHDNGHDNDHGNGHDNGSHGHASPNQREPVGGRDSSEVVHEVEAEKFSVVRDRRESSLTYSRPQDNRIVLEHTFVPPTDRNQGIAESLARRALAYAKQHGLKVVPECSYVARFVEDHAEFQPLLAKQNESTAGKNQHGQTDQGNHEHGHDQSDGDQSKVAVYWPLILTVAYLVGGTAIAMVVAGSTSVMFGMSVFMGLFFVVFSFFKLLDLAGFAEAYTSYDLVAARWMGYGYAYPFIELGLGVAYLLGLMATGTVWPVVTNAVTLVVMVIGTAGVVNAVVRGRDIQCGCLGTMFDLPMSTVTIVEDVSMALMAAGMLVMLLL